MKSPDTIFIERFGLYELNDYAIAALIFEDLKAEKEFIAEMLYDDVSPKMSHPDYETGQYYTSFSSVEDIALAIIEVKEGYDRKMKRYQDKAEMFELAMGILTPREKDVVRVRYFNKENNLGLSPEYFAEVLSESEAKLCGCISEMKKRKKQNEKKAQKEAIRHKVWEWKQAN
jgi:hypothetical protein